MAKEYDILYGEANGVCKELKGVSEVAEFICTEGLKSDVEIFSEDLSLHITTFGIYLDRITDLEYREELLKVLIPMQRKLDGTDNT
ncbi:MAG: hypothetical protein J6K12_00465 [Clostridia bacterium]|nr:hypothetical protein [Clostridia bacterium]